MDECFLVPRFQNESLCETEFVESVGGNHMNGFAFRLVLTQRQNAWEMPCGKSSGV